jgi:nitronate monooxygenase
MKPEAIKMWAGSVRAGTNGGFQLNLWIPDPPPVRDPEAEGRVRAFLADWGPEAAPEAGDGRRPDFAAQCEAMLEVGPSVVSSIMGVFPVDYVARLKARGIRWFATATTVAEARTAEAAGADAIVAQGMEAGGHRGAFEASRAEAGMVALFSLLPAVVDAVRAPVVAAGGIADARGVAAALLLGASAVQIGAGFLRAPEAGLARPWAAALGEVAPEDTIFTRAFSGRAGRSIANAYARAANAPGAPAPAPYPVRRNLTAAMREAAAKRGDINGMQAWAGQSARLAAEKPAAEIARNLWDGARSALG